MANFTVRGETRAAVVRGGRIIIVRGVAAITILGQIVTLIMTTGTTQGGVCSLQRPVNAVIKSDGLPIEKTRAMARLTISGKIQRLMIGIRHAVVIIQMTGYAGCGCARIVTPWMAV